MSLFRKNPRTDDNAKALVEALRRLGCSVQVLSAAGVPDAIVGLRGENYLVEFKRPAGPRGGTSGRDQNPLQRSWASAWRGSKPWILRSEADCFDWVQARIRDLADEAGDDSLETYCTRCKRLVRWLDYPDHARKHPRAVELPADPGAMTVIPSAEEP